MKFQLAGQSLKFQSVYPFDSAPWFVKQIEQMSQKSCFTIIRRSINMKSKLGKQKTCKAVAARFLRTGKGKLKRWRTGKSHKMMHKGPKRSRHLRKPTYVNKQQLKLLNKMLNGWWKLCIIYNVLFKCYLLYLCFKSWNVWVNIGQVSSLSSLCSLLSNFVWEICALLHKYTIIVFYDPGSCTCYYELLKKVSGKNPM